MSFKPQPVILSLGNIQKVGFQDTLPIPSVDKNRMFYIQRTTNKNTIVYELNYTPEGALNEEEPIHVYWIRYAEGGKKAELSYIQNRYAYGLNAVMTDKKTKTFKLNFVSYGKLPIYLVKSVEDQAYHAYMFLDSKKIMISKIYVKIEGGTFWFPKVPYVDITGVDPMTGKTVSHRLIP